MLPLSIYVNSDSTAFGAKTKFRSITNRVMEKCTWLHFHSYNLRSLSLWGQLHIKSQQGSNSPSLIYFWVFFFSLTSCTSCTKKMRTLPTYTLPKCTTKRKRGSIFSSLLSMPYSCSSRPGSSLEQKLSTRHFL